MGRCPYDRLEDLEEILNEVRSWPDIKEKSPGTFYIKSKPFMHFHMKAERRWADIREGDSWGPEVDIPFDAKKTAKKQFLSQVKKCYSKITT